MLNKLLEFIGKSEFGNSTVSPDTILSGLVIADATRKNGDKCKIAVKYIDATASYAAVCDPECHKGALASIDALYVYEEVVNDKKEAPVDGEFESITVKEITALLIDLGVSEDDIKKLGNKQAKFDELKKLQKDLQ